MHSSHRIGDIEIWPVWDGTLDAGADKIIGLEAAEVMRLVERERAASGGDPLVLPVRAFLVRHGAELALVDTGSGTTKGPSMGHLPASLAKLGITPAEIGTVILTHLHMDHIGGLVDEALQPAFPNARLAVHEAEAAYFLDLPEAQLDQRSKRNVAFQRAAVAAYGPRVQRVRDGERVAGLAAWVTPGHTPGHTVWSSGTGRQAVMAIGDVVHLGAVQLPRPEAAMIYDVDPVGAVASRKDVLAQVAAEQTVVAGAHLPGNGLGRIRTEGSGYRFEPLG